MAVSATRRALYAATAAAVGLLAIEGLVQAVVWAKPDLEEVRIEPPDRRQVGLMGADPGLLWRMSPGQRRDGGVDVRINQWGLRGPEPDPERSDVADVLVLGDSSIFGWGVEEHETFASVAAETLRDAGWRVRLINGGTPGYSSTQSRLLLEELTDRLSPEVVVVASLWSDQITSSHSDAELFRLLGSPAASAAVAQRSVLARSALFRVIEARLLAMRPLPSSHEVLIDSILEGDRTTKRVRVDAATHDANLTAMVEQTEAAGGVVVPLVLPANRAVGAPPDSQLESYVGNLAKAARLSGTTLVDFDEVVRALPDSEQAAWFLDVVHPSVAGHRQIGVALARATQDALGSVERNHGVRFH